MLSVRTMTPRTSSKQSSAAASKIKTKLLNTSSFFKVSLKNNNKALAVALEMQKERSRQLEKEIVFLQKQVEALCFELAAKKYKHRKLLLILKNLHSNTLQHLDMVADLFTDSGLPKVSEEANAASGDVNKEDVAVQSPMDQLPPLPDNPEDVLFPLQNVAVDSPEEETCTNVVDVQSKLRLAPDVCSDKRSSGKRQSSQQRPAPQIEISRPSSSLREEVERLSVKISQSGFDMKSNLCPQNSLTPSVLSAHENLKQSLPETVPPPSVSVMAPEPETGSKQEKTLLLNTTMEMTLSDSVEIVTVETKAKRTVPSAKLEAKKKKKKKKEHASGSRVAENPPSQSSADSPGEVQDAPSDVSQTVDAAPQGVREITEPQSPKTQSKTVITSRIPKLNKSEAGSHPKKTKKKLKSIDTAKSKTESADLSAPDLDDYFMNPDVRLSKARESLRLPAEEDPAEEARPRITYRRSRTKGRRMSSFVRNTFTLPSRDSEMRHSELQEIHNEVEEVIQKKYGACKDLPEELLVSAEEVPPPDSEHDANKVQRKEAATHSAGSLKPRCRGTFVVSVFRESSVSSRASEVDFTEPDSVPSAGSSVCEATEEIVTQRLESSPLRQSDGDGVQTTPGSCKRPWLATQDSGSPDQDSSASNDQEADQSWTLESEYQKPKKAKREKAHGSNKKKSVQREERVEDLKEKKQKIKGSNRGFRSEDDFTENSAASPLHAVDGPERNEEQQDDLQMCDFNSDISEKDFPEPSSALKPEKSKTESSHKQKRKTSKLQTATQHRNLRETFVVPRRKTKNKVSLDSFRTSNVSDSFGLTVDGSEAALHQSVGDLLTDELPPWLAIDVSVADTEVDSLPATPRRETWIRAAVTEESAAVTPEASPAGRVLTTVTNTISTPGDAAGGRTRRRHGVVSYKEPTINGKMRRGDKHTDSMFLSSPMFKDGKKKKKKKKTEKTQKKTEAKTKQPIFMEDV